MSEPIFEPAIPERDHSEEIDYENHITRLYCASHMLDAMTEDEIKVYPLVEPILQDKVNDNERWLDIKGLENFCSSKGVAINEVMCRRMVNKFEYDNSGMYFIITNGTEKWKRLDQLREDKILKPYGKVSNDTV